jgi:hypothetical protein
MGEKAATNEVITKLVSVLADQSEDVRGNACSALGNMGEKAATNEVITKLVNALGDQSGNVRKSAREALGKMGEKAGTNEVISQLVVWMNTDSRYSAWETAEVIRNILSWPTVIKRLSSKIVADLCRSRYASDCLKNISEKELINFYLITKSPNWLPALIQLTHLREAAITTTGNKIVLYGTTEPVELYVSDSVLRQQLIDAFLEYRKRLHLSLEISADAIHEKGTKVKKSGVKPCRIQ